MSLRNAETSTKTEAMQSWFINSAPTSRIEHPLPPTGRRRRVAGAGWCSASPGSGDSHTADRLERFTRDSYGFGHRCLILWGAPHVTSANLLLTFCSQNTCFVFLQNLFYLCGRQIGKLPCHQQTCQNDPFLVAPFAKRADHRLAVQAERYA